MKRFLAGAAVAAVLATGGVAVAGAAEGPGSSATTATTGTSAAATTNGARGAGPLARLATYGIKTAATTIGVSPADLRSAIKQGQTIADVAKAHNVDPKTVEDAIIKGLDDRIDQAVTNGKIRSDRAADLKASVAKRVPQFVEHTVAVAKRARAHAKVAGALAVAAKAIGIEPKDLAAALKNGQSVADVAKAHNVDPQTVIDALVKAGDARVLKMAQRFVNNTHPRATTATSQPAS